MEQPTHLVVGFVARPHGNAGEVLVSPLTDNAETVFAPGVALLSAVGEAETPDPDFPPLRVESVRPVQRGLLVGFGGIESRSEADLLRGRYLMAALEELPALEEGELFYHQLLGMRVLTTAGEELGTVREVFELQPADLLEVRGPRGTVLLPFSRQVVREVDPDARRLVVDPPEGLLDL